MTLSVLFLCIVIQGNAQPLETLPMLVAQLQQHPLDDALREKVIRLVRETRPESVVLPEALQLENAGLTLFKKAKTPLVADSFVSHLDTNQY